MRGPRRGAALSTPAGRRPAPPAPLPQAWVPRVLNAALAVFLLCCVVPLLSTFSDHSRLVQVYLLVVVLPVVLVIVLCLASALRPGSLGRLARRVRARRQG